MAGLATPFKIVSEFAFEEVHARSSEDLTKKVKGISAAADEAIRSVKYLGMEFGLQFTGLGGGIIGMLKQAVDLSEEYKQVQNDLASIISSTYNMGAGVETFNKQLQMSEDLITKIVKTAHEFALPETQMAGGMIPLLGVLGSKRGQGKFKGDPADEALKLSRLSMKFASSFNIKPCLLYTSPSPRD